MQVQYGFTPPFIGTIALYVIAIVMYYFYFLRGRKKLQRQHVVPRVEAVEDEY